MMASYLGEIGDKRAMSALREATEQGDSGVRESAYCGLYKLGEYSVDEILATIGEISFWGEAAQG
jgi:HEAT repeat protein